MKRTHLRILHLLYDLPPQMLRLHDAVPVKIRFVIPIPILLYVLLVRLSGDVAENDALPSPVRGVAFLLYVLQPLEVP